MKLHVVTLNMTLFDIVACASMLKVCAEIVHKNAMTPDEKALHLSLLGIINSLKLQGTFIAESDKTASDELDKITANMLKQLDQIPS